MRQEIVPEWDSAELGGPMPTTLEHDAQLTAKLARTRQNSAGLIMPATLEHGAQLTANLGGTQWNSVGTCANDSRARQNSAELGRTRRAHARHPRACCANSSRTRQNSANPCPPSSSMVRS